MNLEARHPGLPACPKRSDCCQVHTFIENQSLVVFLQSSNMEKLAGTDFEFPSMWLLHLK